MNDDNRAGLYCDETLLREFIARLAVLEVNLENVKHRIEGIEKSSQELNKNVQEIKANYDKALGAIQLVNWIAIAVVTLTAGIGGYFLSGQVSEVQQEVEHNHAPVKQIPQNLKTPKANQGK